MQRWIRAVVVAGFVVGGLATSTPVAAGPEPTVCRNLHVGIAGDVPAGRCRLLDERTIVASFVRVYAHEDLGGTADLEERTAGPLNLSFAKFTALGIMPTKVDVLIVPALVAAVEEEDAYGVAQADDEGTCVVQIPESTLERQETYQHTLAHELFHCFEFKQVGFNRAGGAADWWYEGAAEYFANVVYPREDEEHEYLPGFREEEPNQSLMGLDYEAYVFFQYMANRVGNAEVVRFLTTLPTEGGEGAQIEAAAAWPGMDELFHDYARALLAHEIKDASGRFIPIDPEQANLGTETVDGPGEVFSYDDLAPFKIHRIKLVFEERHEFDLEYLADAGIRSGAQLGDTGAPWEDGLPDPLETCNAPQRWRMVMTTTEPGVTHGVSLDAADAVELTEDDLPLRCCADDAAAGPVPRAERREVRITVCGAITAEFVGGVCYVDGEFLNVAAGVDAYGPGGRATGAYPNGYAFILGIAVPGTEPSGFPNVSISDGNELTEFGSGASLTKSTDLLRGTFFTADGIAGTYRCPRLTPLEELD